MFEAFVSRIVVLDGVVDEWHVHTRTVSDPPCGKAELQLVDDRTSPNRGQEVCEYVVSVSDPTNRGLSCHHVFRIWVGISSNFNPFGHSTIGFGSLCHC